MFQDGQIRMGKNEKLVLLIRLVYGRLYLSAKSPYSSENNLVEGLCIDLLFIRIAFPICLDVFSTGSASLSVDESFEVFQERR